MRHDLTRERLAALLKYDPETGAFTRLVSSGRGGAGGIAGSPDRNGHIQITVDRRRYAAHRLAWFYVTGEWPEGVIDHRNGARSDNRFNNLRDISQEANTQNLVRATRRNQCGLLGVRRNRSRLNPWSAVIVARGQFKHIGVFPTPEAAHAAYVTAKRQLHEGNTL